MNKVNGYLPIFPGFEYTIFEFDDDRLESDIQEDIRENRIVETISFDDLKIDYKQYCIDVSKQCVEYVENQLKSLNMIESIEFEKIQSPREYNFSNDEIHCVFNYDDDHKKNIIKYLDENKNSFNDYILDNFSDRSGFMSFYTNDGEQWYDDFNNNSFKNEGTQFSVILDFILGNEEENPIDEMYDSLRDICESDYVLNYDDFYTEEYKNR